MESRQELKHRGKDDDVGTATATAEAEKKSSNDRTKQEQEKRKVMARRGMRSLGLAVVIPLVITLLATGVPNLSHRGQSKQFWFVPPWVLITGSAVSASAMAVAAWLVWAEGGFHKRPASLYLYLGQLGSSLAWEAALFGAREARIGLALGLAMVAATFQCHRVYRQLNPIAALLVRPCLAWATFVAAVNAKLAML